MHNVLSAVFFMHQDNPSMVLNRYHTMQMMHNGLSLFFLWNV